MFGRLMNGKKIEEKLDQLVKMTSDINTSVSLLEQSHDQVKKDQHKTTSTVEVHHNKLAQHESELEKLTNYSSSHKKNIEELQDKFGEMEETMKIRQPLWNVLTKIWDRFLYLSIGAGLLYLAKIINLG